MQIIVGFSVSDYLCNNAHMIILCVSINKCGTSHINGLEITINTVSITEYKLDNVIST